MRRFAILPLAAALLLLNAGCLFRHPNLNPLAGVNSAQPDKALFDRAMADLAKDKFTTSRLLLQTLINTYPDSEYLARAKMAIGDSWYREGGTEGLAQAEAEYRDFITFFPTMKEAQEAQLKICEIHFRELQKPDRDPTNALAAEQDLRTFLLSYPSGKMAVEAREMLRQVDEVLAEGEFRVASFYLRNEEFRAAQSRLLDVVNKYPLYSRGDEAMAMLAHSYLVTSGRYAWAVRNEPNTAGVSSDLMKDLALNETRDRASALKYYTRLIERYPLSPEVGEAKRELAALRAPVPKPTPQAIAFNKEEIAGRTEPGRFVRWTGMFRGAPVTALDRADRVGNPPLGEQQANAATATTGDAEIAAITTPPSESATGSETAANSVGAAGGGLSFQNVGAGGFTDPNNADTPQATEATDVTAGSTVAASTINGDASGNSTANQNLTPDELDKLQKEQMLANEVERTVPYPHKIKRAKPRREPAAEAAKRGKAAAQAAAGDPPSAATHP